MSAVARLLTHAPEMAYTFARECTEEKMSFDQSFRFLDTEADRRQLIEEIRQIRRAVISMTETVPEEKWYEPRYHGSANDGQS